MLKIDFKNFKIEELDNSLPVDVRILNLEEFSKKENFTISDHLDFGVTNGSENLYFDLILYTVDCDKPLKLRMFTKDNHKGLKKLICHILNF